MDSQEDIFATQEPKKKKTKYNFVVLCDKDEHAQEPFSVCPTNMFSENEIQGRWLDSVLDASSRIKTLTTLEMMQDRNFSLFGKFEEGIIHKI